MVSEAGNLNLTKYLKKVSKTAKLYLTNLLSKAAKLM